MIYFWIGLVVGIAVASIVSYIIRRCSCVGTLRVDRSDPDDGHYLFLELQNMSDVVNRRYVTFRVRIDDFLPHK